MEMGDFIVSCFGLSSVGSKWTQHVFRVRGSKTCWLYYYLIQFARIELQNC